MFATGPAPEIVAGDQDRCVLEIGAVEQIIGIGAQRLERALAHPLARRGLQPVRGNDDVGVDILEPERDRATFDFFQRGHAINSRTSVSLPVTAAARSEERLVGKECVSTFRSRWSPYH